MTQHKASPSHTAVITQYNVRSTIRRPSSRVKKGYMIFFILLKSMYKSAGTRNQNYASQITVRHKMLVYKNSHVILRCLSNSLVGKVLCVHI
ncbi:hypothetical protein FKM82_031069 [Ascaphus truei]